MYMFDQCPLWINDNYEAKWEWSDREKPIYFLNREEAGALIVMMQLTGEEDYDIYKVKACDDDVGNHELWEILHYSDEEIKKYLGEDFFNKYCK
jgi:hypothetical protein